MVPEVKLKDLMNKMHRCIGGGDTETAVRLWYQFRHRNLSSIGPMSKYFGSVYIAFRNVYQKLLDSHFGNDGSKIKQMVGAAGIATFRRAQAAVTQKFTANPGASKDQGKFPLDNYIQLSKFEEWVAKTGESIELPGQYGGAQRPQPELHIRIINFDPQILVMSSLRRPKRVTIHGSDERSHPYLVKGGEDLRMDQRVEQVFGSMNDILHADASASRRRLGLRTYQVVPLTPTLGMLEWVSHTAPLKGLISDAIGQQGGVAFNSMSLKYNQNLMAEYPSSAPKPPNSTHQSVYYSYLKMVDRKRVTEQFMPLQNQLPSDLIAKALARMCNTPELFLSCRSMFARSFASLTVCFYILGMGDRHLENFLVDTTNGELVGIDFGAAFGQGVQLSVPELMPIRFTRQLQHILAPLQTEPILAQDMTYVMRALRNRKAVLTTVMDVFVKEPQMEWSHASKTHKMLGQETSTTDAGSIMLAVLCSVHVLVCCCCLLMSSLPCLCLLFCPFVSRVRRGRCHGSQQRLVSSSQNARGAAQTRRPESSLRALARVAREPQHHNRPQVAGGVHLAFGGRARPKARPARPRVPAGRTGAGAARHGKGSKYPRTNMGRMGSIHLNTTRSRAQRTAQRRVSKRARIFPKFVAVFSSFHKQCATFDPFQL